MTDQRCGTCRWFTLKYGKTGHGECTWYLSVDNINTPYWFQQPTPTNNKNGKWCATWQPPTDAEGVGEP